MSKNLMAGVALDIMEGAQKFNKSWEALVTEFDQLKTLTDKQDDTISDHDDQIKALEKIIEDLKETINVLERKKKPKPK